MKGQVMSREYSKPIPFTNHQLWRTRGYLPHYDGSQYQMITYRLADSLPEHILQNLDDDSLKRRNQIEQYLDVGHGSCLLGIPEVAQEVINSWNYFSGERYDLIAGVVMPNHVHVLIKTNDEWPVSKIVWSWKTHMTNFIRKDVLDVNAAQECSAPAKIWQREYWDRFIRDEKHFNSALKYIWENPSKAGLVKHEEKWRYLV
ncbi:MAG: transposase [Lentisphaeraceae bacterium]|nr:transposase [Lentisphaeraceae bacterium]